MRGERLTSEPSTKPEQQMPEQSESHEQREQLEHDDIHKKLGTAARLVDSIGEMDYHDTADTANPTDPDTRLNMSDSGLRNMKELARRFNGDALRKNPELLDSWAVDRREENLAYLQRVNPDLAIAYCDLMLDQEFCDSGLKYVKIEAMSDKDIKKMGRSNAYFSALQQSSDTGKYVPVVRLNLRDPDAYSGDSIAESNGDLGGYSARIGRKAMLLGIKPGELTNNTKLMGAMVMMHELGHAHDFMQNYLAPELSRNSRRMRQALPGAVEKFSAQSDQERMRSLSGANRELILEAFYGRFSGMGCRSMTDARRMAQLAYRDKGKEKYADDFAAKFLRRFLDDYGLKQHIGETLRVRPEDEILLDCWAGTKVSYIKVDQNNRQLTNVQSGYLTDILRSGKPLDLCWGDPLNQDSRMRKHVADRVSSISITSSASKSDPSGTRTTLTIRTSNGERYLLRKSPDQEQVEIPASANELSSTLNLRAGTLLRLLKTGSKKSDDFGEVLSGRLVPTSGTVVSEGKPIVLGDAKDGLQSGSTPIVRRVFRKWKTYFVETTDGSVYEVLRGSNLRSKRLDG